MNRRKFFSFLAAAPVAIITTKAAPIQEDWCKPVPFPDQFCVPDGILYTVPNSKEIFYLGPNQRASYRWVAAPRTVAERGVLNDLLS